jgi:chromosome partitioning protein
MSMRTIAVVSMKGGVGKTTLALSIAVSMAREMKRKGRLLVVDSDPQGNASMTLLDGEPPADPTLSQVLLAEVEVKEAIRPSSRPAIDLLPADASLADCTLLLADQMGREQRLRAALRDVEKQYDVCIIDAPPTMSLLNVNVLNAAQSLVVPVDPGIYSAVGLGKLQETVEQVRRHLCHPDLAIVALAIVRIQRHKAHADFERQLRELYGSLVLKATVPDSVMVSVACSHHKTVVEYAPASPAAVALERLVKELMDGKSAGHKNGNSGHHDRKPSKRRAG